MNHELLHFGVRLLLHKGVRLCWDTLAVGLIMTVQLKGRQSVSALEFVLKLDSIQEKSSMNWLTMRNESRIASSLKRSRLMFFLKNFFCLSMF